MDAIVFRFDAESLGRVQYLERVEWLLTLATLYVVLYSGRFVRVSACGRTILNGWFAN